MRNERGQYLNLKAIMDNGPEWASGCDKCKCGVLSAPDLTGAVPLYLERLVQAVDHDIDFCNCEAGQKYQVSLRNRYQATIEQDKQAKRIITHKVAGSEATLTPDNTLRIDGLLDVARVAIDAARARNRPTVHADGERAPRKAERVMA